MGIWNVKKKQATRSRSGFGAWAGGLVAVVWALGLMPSVKVSVQDVEDARLTQGARDSVRTMSLNIEQLGEIRTIRDEVAATDADADRDGLRLALPFGNQELVIGLTNSNVAYAQDFNPTFIEGFTGGGQVVLPPTVNPGDGVVIIEGVGQGGIQEKTVCADACPGGSDPINPIEAWAYDYMFRVLVALAENRENPGGFIDDDINNGIRFVRYLERSGFEFAPGSRVQAYVPTAAELSAAPVYVVGLRSDWRDYAIEPYNVTNRIWHGSFNTVQSDGYIDNNNVFLTSHSGLYSPIVRDGHTAQFVLNENHMRGDTMAIGVGPGAYRVIARDGRTQFGSFGPDVVNFDEEAHSDIPLRVQYFREILENGEIGRTFTIAHSGRDAAVMNILGFDLTEMSRFTAAGFDMSCDNFCGDTLDITLTDETSGDETIVRAFYERQGGTSVLRSLQMVDETSGRLEGAPITNLTSVYNDSPLADEMPALMFQSLQAYLPRAQQMHDTMHDTLDTITPSDFNFVERNGMLQLGSTVYGVSFEPGEPGKLPTVMETTVSGVTVIYRLVEGTDPETGATTYRYAPDELPSGVGVIDDCALMHMARIISQLERPVPVANIQVELPADETPPVVDVSNIDVSVVEDCVTDIDGYNAQNSRVIKVVDGTTTRYYLARFGTDTDGEIDTNVTLLAGSLNAQGQFVADAEAQPISAYRALGIDFDGSETRAQDRAEGVEIFRQARAEINADIKRCADGCTTDNTVADPTHTADLASIDRNGDEWFAVRDGELHDASEGDRGAFHIDYRDDRPVATGGGTNTGPDMLALAVIASLVGAGTLAVSTSTRGRNRVSARQRFTHAIAGIGNYVGGALLTGGVTAAATVLTGGLALVPVAVASLGGAFVGHILNVRTRMLDEVGDLAALPAQQGVMGAAIHTRKGHRGLTFRAVEGVDNDRMTTVFEDNVNSIIGSIGTDGFADSLLAVRRKAHNAANDEDKIGAQRAISFLTTIAWDDGKSGIVGLRGTQTKVRDGAFDKEGVVGREFEEMLKRANITGTALATAPAAPRAA